MKRRDAKGGFVAQGIGVPGQEERLGGKASAPSLTRQSLGSLTVFPIVIYLASRCLSALFLAEGGARQLESRAPNQATHALWDIGRLWRGYAYVITNWDGGWYKSIALHGYPERLPEIAGRVGQSEYAFYPAYPYAVRAITSITGAPFEVVAPFINFGCGAAAMVLLYRYLLAGADRFTAGASVVCINVYAAAPIFQVSYTEGLAMLLLVASLRALTRRAYLVVASLAVGLALTRPIIPALCLVLAIHGFSRWRDRATNPLYRRERIRLVCAMSITASSVLLWPTLAALRTHRWDAFFATQSAWSPSYVAHAFGFSWLAGVYNQAEMLGVLLLLGLSAMLGLILLQPSRAAWPLELRTWAIAYPAYISAVTPLAGSAVRYFLLSLIPLWPFPRRRNHNSGRDADVLKKAALVALVFLGLACQYIWSVSLFSANGTTGTYP